MHINKPSGRQGPAQIHSGILALGILLSLWSLSASGLIKFPDKTNKQQILNDSQYSRQNIQAQQQTLQHQRALFLKAELSLAIHQYKKFQQQLEQLQDYPLVPYLLYKNMHRQLGRLSLEDIKHFFAQYPQQPLSFRLRRDLIRYYEKHQRWQDLIAIYSPQSSPGLQCAYLQALVKRGQSTLAFPQVKKLWLSGQSRPRNCDPVFRAWEAAGLKTDELIWQRIALAIPAGNSRLASFLSKSLPSDEREWVKLWLRIHRNPEQAMQSRLLKTTATHPYAQQIALHGIKRLCRQNPYQAIASWHQISSYITFNQQQLNQIYRSIGLSMARQHQSRAAQWLEKIPDSMADSQVLEWRIRSSIRSANWPDTLHFIEALPVKNQSSLRWQFWWAYAHAQLGHQLEASSTYHYLASRRSYYGFLAADQLNLPYAFENHPLEVDQQTIFHISQQPAALRAHELYRLGRILDARREWYELSSGLDSAEKLAAAKLAQQWQWHDRAIFTMGQTDYRDDIELRFPLTLLKTIHSWSQKRQINTAWTYAIIRRESAFMSDARSPAGALGLMQLMPATARQIARKMQLRYRGRNSLLSTETNIKLGTGYLEQMLARNSQQTVLATAAYNAGPRRVDHWLPEHQPMEAIRWIETIPYTETREYVSNVLAYTIIYQHRMGLKHSRLRQKMPPVPARSTLAQAKDIKSKNSS